MKCYNKAVCKQHFSVPFLLNCQSYGMKSQCPSKKGRILRLYAIQLVNSDCQMYFLCVIRKALLSDYTSLTA